MTTYPTTAQSVPPAQDTTPSRPARGPLAGLRVLDLGTVDAAPITAMLLGDWGPTSSRSSTPAATPPDPTA